MKTVISLRDVEALLAQGQDLRALPADAIVTPSARDRIRDVLEAPGGAPGNPFRMPVTLPTSVGMKPTPPVHALNSKCPQAGLEAFFSSPYCEDLKQQICDVGRRLWERAYVDGNGGNIAIRVGEDLALCTPTLVSKGSMKPSDLCLVDFEGNQLLGTKKRTSEILMHLQMMKRQPRDVASVHCHPPYATAFAIAGLEPPTCMIPEYEVFCSVAVAPYRTPGTPEMGRLVADLVETHNTILMANHGVVTWSHNHVEEAYWRMEIIEAYCRTLVVAAQLGTPMKTFSPGHLKDLLNIKQGLGFVDPRHELKECELCDNNEWRPGVSCQAPASRETPIAADPEIEALVKAVTDQIMARLK